MRYTDHVAIRYRRLTALLGVVSLAAVLCAGALGTAAPPAQAGVGANVPAQSVPAVTEGPQPGDIFREYVYPFGLFNECDPGSNADLKLCGDPNRTDAAQRKVPNVDIQSASRAEVAVEYWGGHDGTTDQKFTINDARPLSDPGINWIPVPQPQNTPSGKPECYFRNPLGMSTSVPLNQLKQGENFLRFTTGPQTCYRYGTQYGFYYIYDFAIRVYYNNSVTHPTGQITSPTQGSILNERPTITANATAPAGRSINRVEFIGYFTDFDWDGDGRFTQWQYALEKGRVTRHIGTDTSAPYSVTWNNDWVPDQEGAVKIAARIVDNTGMTYMTPAVDAFFQRTGGKSVKMYSSTDCIKPSGACATGDRKFGVSENFGVRAGNSRTSYMNLPTDIDLSKVQQVRLVMPTWAGTPAPSELYPLSDTIRLNTTTIITPYGKMNTYDFVQKDLPVSAIKKGENQFFLRTEREGHRLEINWPGPVLLVQSGNIVPGNTTPTVASGANATVEEGAAFTRSGSFIDPNQDSWTAQVNWDDGTTEALELGADKTFNLNHTYADNGDFTVTVTVDDGKGGVGTATFKVTVTNKAPTITSGGDQAGKPGTPVEVTANFADAGSGDVHTAEIDWGDGQKSSGTVIQGTGTITGSHTYAAKGEYTVKITVADDEDAAAETTLKVIITDNPVVANDDTADTGAGAPVQIAVVSNDSGGAGGLKVVSVTQPANGKAEVSGDTGVRYTPNEGFSGTDTFNYTVSDGNVNATGTVTVNVRAGGGGNPGFRVMLPLTSR
jgi:hypothetical protein